MEAQTVMLTWTPSTNSDVAGYNIYCGTQSRVYTNMIPVGVVTNTTITNLAPGLTYYFAATSHDSSTNESGYSDETVFTVPLPVVVSNPPPVITNTAPVITNTAPVIVTYIPPTLAPLANISVNRNSGQQTVALTGITGGTTNGSPIRVTATSSNPKLINPNVTYTSPKTTGTLNFKPQHNGTGTAIVTVTVSNGGTNNSTVSQSFTVSVATPVTQAAIAAVPKVYSQPQSKTVASGAMVTLSVGVSGRAPFHYQWQFKGQNIPGATSSFLSLRKFNAAQAGEYSVQVSNSFGAVNSSTAVLTLPAATPAIASVPRVNPSASLTAMPAAGHGQFSFQIRGISGTNYVVEASSDLIGWTPVYTNASPFLYTETNSLAYSHRYYRATYLP